MNTSRNAPTPRYSSLEEAFAARTVEVGDCIVWTGAKTVGGYGRMRGEGAASYAHCYAWSRQHGPIPLGMEVDHTCWNRACVNINHLRLASRAQNNANLNGPRKSNRSTGVRNVYPNGNGYRVAISHKGKQLSFGTYPTIEEASRVAEQKRREVFGQFAGRG